MSVREVVLMVKNGIVDPVSIPEGVTVIVRDYDFLFDDDDIVQTDNDGSKYLEVIFDHTDSAVED